MDRAISLEARRIDLTIELPFKLGDVRIDPRAHEMSWDGELRRLQPLTMKVLVALHDKANEVVTRDELVDRCWDGRFVGEDVINRCVSLLRRVAAQSGGFEIQTVPTTGYRLTAADNRPSKTLDRRPLRIFDRPIGSYHRLIAGGALVLAIIAGGTFAVVRSRHPAVDAVMLKPFDVAGNAPLARTVAAGVSADVNSALSAAGVDVLDPDSSGKSSAKFLLSGRAELPGTDLHLTAELQDAQDHAVLWSTTFTRPATQAQAMQEQVADNLAQVLHCALDTSRHAGGDKLDQDSIKLYLRACALEQAVVPPSDQIQDLLRQVTVREPDFAAGWERLAIFAANAAFDASPDEAEKLRQEARMAVNNAIRLDPKSGEAYDAIAALELGRVPFSVLYRQFQKVLSFDPDDTFIINDECELLLRLGSLDESMHVCRRGVELEPLSPAQVSDLVAVLIDESRDAEATATLERARRVWPDERGLKIDALDYEARSGDPTTALAILSDPQARPQMSNDYLEFYRRLAIARKSGRAGERAFIAWVDAPANSGRIDPQVAAPALAGLGDVNDAFKIAFAAPSNILDHGPDPQFLWSPDSQNLRRDPRFIALAVKFHIADFWNSTGMWPDFCFIPNWPYDCKAEYAKVLARQKN